MRNSQLCESCGGKDGSHSHLCKRFVCISCGRNGPLPDHEKGCPEIMELWGVESFNAIKGEQ